MVLLAVKKLEPDAYGVKIRQAVAEATERDVSIGAIYATLDRLESKDYVNSWQGEATPERGGRAKRYWRVTQGGLRTLREQENVRRRLLDGLDLGTLASRRASEGVATSAP